MPDDPGVCEESLDIALPKRGHCRRVETLEHLAESLPFAKNGDPGEARLETLQGDLLEEPLIRRGGAAPLLVVVGPIDVRFGTPPASLLAVRTDDEAVTHVWSSSRSREAELMQ